jgi:hypothetical protein
LKYKNKHVLHLEEFLRYVVVNNKIIDVTIQIQS